MYQDELKLLRVKRGKPDREQLELLCNTFHRIKSMMEKFVVAVPDTETVGNDDVFFTKYDIDAACNAGIRTVLDNFFEPKPNANPTSEILKRRQDSISSRE